ncbi:MAG: ORF6N domain-containing protein, partial [Bacteroidetes bacterium]|nr:ORF6N domain-containing protein [Bacteroidota bacterium]
MSVPAIFKLVEQNIISIRETKVILDSDVAFLYGVQTKHVNQAVKNNPEKFPDGYVFMLDNFDLEDLRSKFLTAKFNPKSRVMPKAFTEKGLYMLATIIKSPVATATTIAIIETFTRIRQFSGVIDEIQSTIDTEKKKTLAAKGGELFREILGDGLQTKDTETTIEFNLALLRLKHTVKR